MFGGAVQSIFDGPSLKASWKIFFQALGIKIDIDTDTDTDIDIDKKGADKNHSFNLALGTYSPLWLANEQISIAIESYNNNARRAEGKSIRYQEAADQSKFPILCIKGFPQPNRYSVRLFAPRVKAHIYPKFYWATFAEGADQKLCLIEGNKYWYVQDFASIDSAQALSTPKRHSQLILKALDCANTRMVRAKEYRLSCGFAE